MQENILGNNLNLQINPQLDLEYLKDTFTKTRSVVIENFLTKESALNLYNFFTKIMPKDWWYISYAGHYDKMKMERLTDEYLSKTDLQKEVYEPHYASMAKGNFSYIFNRTGPHFPECTCGYCQYLKLMQSPLTLGIFSKITGQSYSHLGEFFASEFTPGQFLSKHHDIQKGKLSAVYSLAKDWDSTFGGNLYILKDDWKTVEKVVLSTFNRMNLMEIPDGRGKPHFVSQVSHGVKQHRLSITGWIS
jgi:hypothetical protein